MKLGIFFILLMVIGFTSTSITPIANATPCETYEPNCDGEGDTDDGDQDPERPSDPDGPDSTGDDGDI